MYYNKAHKTWSAKRRSKYEKKTVSNGNYKYEDAAAHASDTLARKLMENGEQNHILNFPEDDTKVFPEKVTTNLKGFTKSFSFFRDQNVKVLRSELRYIKCKMACIQMEQN